MIYDTTRPPWPFDRDRPRAFHEIPVDDLPVSVRAAFLAFRRDQDSKWEKQLMHATVGDLRRLFAALAEGIGERALDAKYEAMLAEQDRERASLALCRAVPLADAAAYLRGMWSAFGHLMGLFEPRIARLREEHERLRAENEQLRAGNARWHALHQTVTAELGQALADGRYQPREGTVPRPTPLPSPRPTRRRRSRRAEG